MANNKKDKRETEKGDKRKKEKEDIILMGAPKEESKSFPKGVEASKQLNETKSTRAEDARNEGVKIEFGDDVDQQNTKTDELPNIESKSSEVTPKEHVGLGKMFLWLLTLFVAYLIVGQIFDLFGPTTISLLALWPLLLVLIGLSLFKVKRKSLSHVVAFLLVVVIFFAGSILVFKRGDVVTISVSDVSVTEDRGVDPFTSIEFAGRGEVIVREGERDAVLVTADEAVIEEVTTDVEGGTLRIGYSNILWSLFLFEETTLRVEVVTTDLSKFELSGIGDVLLEDLTSEELDVSLTGEGSMSVTGLSTTELIVRLVGNGDMSLEGTSDRTLIYVPGEGRVEAEALQSREAAVRVDGTGYVFLSVNESLDASVQGSGDVVYSGNPTLMGVSELDPHVYSTEEMLLRAETEEAEEENQREEESEPTEDDAEVVEEEEPIVRDPKMFLKDIDTTL